MKKGRASAREKDRLRLGIIYEIFLILFLLFLPVPNKLVCSHLEMFEVSVCVTGDSMSEFTFLVIASYSIAIS